MGSFSTSYQDGPAQRAQRERRRTVADKALAVSRERMAEITADFKDLTADLSQRERRRRAEREVARYVAADVVPHVERTSGWWEAAEFALIAEKLATCRCAGIVGLSPDGKRRAIHDEQCGIVQLCPDESRAEFKRLDAIYRLAICDQRAAGRRVYKAVLTWPNAPLGKLREAQVALWARWRAFLRAKRLRDPRFPVIGALAVMECPLSGRGTWNPHLNVILVCDNWLDYLDLKRFWHWQLDIDDEKSMRTKTEKKMRERGDDPSNLTDDEIIGYALREIIKYPVVTVGEKAEKGAGGEWEHPWAYMRDGKMVAPPLTDWPAAAFVEWWRCTYRIRRTRASGVLFDSEGSVWALAPEERRRELLEAAELPDYLARCKWRAKPSELPASRLLVDARKALRDVLRDRDVVNLAEVDWYATLEWRGDRYLVTARRGALLDSIPGDKFATHRATATPATGPPPCEWDRYGMEPPWTLDYHPEP